MKINAENKIMTLHSKEKELQNHTWPVVKGSYTLSDF